VNPYGAQPALQAPQTRSAGALARLPGKSTLEYTKLTIEVLLLLLAVPWIVRELARNPGGASRRAATKHLAGP
jgi:hypothetical protein